MRIVGESKSDSDSDSDSESNSSKVGQNRIKVV